MKSIVVGYSDAGGRTSPRIVCGPEVPDAEQARMFLKAKRGQEFPEGVARMEWGFFDPDRGQIAIAVKAEASGVAEPADDPAESAPAAVKASPAKRKK